MISVYHRKLRINSSQRGEKEEEKFQVDDQAALDKPNYNQTSKQPTTPLLCS
jgi:hypothetical protein